MEAEVKNEEVKMENVEGTENIPTFLSKTFEILENTSYQDIISWTKNGYGFVVKKVKEFSEKILPLHFRHNNYSSFVRQLNMYDFHKMRQDNQENAFKNGLFKRGSRHLLKEIQRKDYKKNRYLRVQISNIQQNAARYNQLNNEVSSLNREVETYLEASRQFYAKSLQACTNNMLQIKKQWEELLALETMLQSEAADNKYDRELSHSVVDSLMKLKRYNGSTMDYIYCFYEDEGNFFSKKNIKWNSLMPDSFGREQSAKDVKGICFPTWVTSMDAIPVSVASLRD